MEFFGAAHYFFWQGIKKGINNKIENLYECPETEPIFKTETGLNCVESFIDGFILGLAMSMSDYRDITELRIEKKKEIKVQKVEKKTKALVPITDKNNITWN